MGTLIHSLGHNTPGLTDLIVETVLLFFDFVAVGMRLWSRRIQRVGLQVNDWLIIVALVLMTGRYVVEITVILLCGLGLHTDEVAVIGGPIAFVRFKQLAYADDLLWVSIVTLIKLSILHFYIKVFRNPVFIRCAYVVMGLCISFWIAGFFATAFFCVPPQKDWLPDIPGHCGSSDALYSGCASSDLIIDVITILLPMPVLWSLQLPTAKKIALTGVFALGFVIIAITSVRIKYMLSLDVADPTYGFSKIALLSGIVPLLGILNACLPILPPAIRVIFGTSIFDTTPGRSATGGSNGYWKKGMSTNGRSRLEDTEMPLVKVTQSTVSGPLDIQRSSNRTPNAGIHITSDFDVQSIPEAMRYDRERKEMSRV